MKEWDDVPEFRDMWDKFMKKVTYYGLTYKQRMKPGNEFDTEYEEYCKKAKKEMLDFQNKYRKEHPEEFDENGNFKEDTK